MKTLKYGQPLVYSKHTRANLMLKAKALSGNLCLVQCTEMSVKPITCFTYWNTSAYCVHDGVSMKHRLYCLILALSGL